MAHSKQNFAFVIAAAWSLLNLTEPATAQTPRSTSFQGAGRAIYAARPEYDANVEMTIEAWIYLNGYDSECQTIVSNGRAQSFWFGVCDNRLRFYRSGGLSATMPLSVSQIRPNQWIHVAAVYTGTSVRLYMDGALYRSPPLGHAGAGHFLPLYIGDDPEGGVEFNGYIDELRIWSEARTSDQIAAGMYDQARNGSALVGAWPMGAGEEATHGWQPITSSGMNIAVFGILPRDLIIPRSPIPVVVDGEIDGGSEYAGAEQLVMRYRTTDPNIPAAADAVAYLVHDDDNLYVAFGAPRPFYDGTTTPYIGLLLDSDYSRQPDQGGAFAISPFDGVGTASWHVWDEFLGIYRNCQTRECPPAGSWQAVQGDCGDDVGPPCVEYRISRSLLGEWTELDGIGIGHFQVSPDGDYYMAPDDADPSVEATWSTASYVDSSTELPHGRISGRVFDNASPNRSRPLANAQVRFGGRTGGPQYVQYTNAQGEFSFDVPIPIGMDVSVEIQQCGGCRQSTPLVSGNGIQPITIANHLVSFPGCDVGSCVYASVDFFNQQAIPPTTIDSLSPNCGTPQIIIRDSNPRLVEPATSVQLVGSNLHTFAALTLARTRGSTDPEDWTHYSAEILGVTADGSRLMTRVPSLPPNFAGAYRWVFADEWVRPGYEPRVISDVWDVRAPYPSVHGLGFDNASDAATLSDFFSCFGDNGYLCIGVGGFCICNIPDPLYFLYWPIYANWTELSGGSCHGMSGASLMIKRGILSADDFDAGAHHARGLENRPSEGTYDWDWCGPPEPTNIWGYIRMYHGTQTSAEAINTALIQLNEGGGVASWETSPRQRLAAIRTEPDRYALSLSPGIGDGHVVVPWKIEELTPNVTRIWVYDNNNVYSPGVPAESYVDVDINADIYTFPRSNGEIWQGRGMFTFRDTLYSGARSAPGIEQALLWMGLFVFGDAYPRVELIGTGHEWGWRPDGTFVDNMPGALALSPMGPSESSSRSVPLILPNDIDGAPRIEINPTGSHYLFHAAAQGTMLQIEATNAVPGTTDAVRIGRLGPSRGNLMRNMTFTPRNANLRFTPRIGMNLGLNQRAVFKLVGLDVPPNRAVRFEALHERKGIEIANGAPTTLRYTLVTETVDGGEEEHATMIFGPLDIPSGMIQTVALNDWPFCNEIRCELDVDADGIPDEVTVVSGTRCGGSPLQPESDQNGNGIPDVCDRRSGDVNCDGNVNNFDIEAFVTALSDPVRYAERYPGCLILNADANDDGRVNNFDIDAFVACIENGGCP
ncbi:MAG: hypothetical protein JNG88_00155 [Phycisphaerales bacterium]|nr:hypothetical protein [Phycisphaerales bacterium]